MNFGYTETMRNPDTKRVTFDLPPELYERLRTTAFEQRTRMSRVGIECLRRCLAQPDRTLDTPAPYPGKASSSSE